MALAKRCEQIENELLAPVHEPGTVQHNEQANHAAPHKAALKEVSPQVMHDTKIRKERLTPEHRPKDSPRRWAKRIRTEHPAGCRRSSGGGRTNRSTTVSDLRFAPVKGASRIASTTYQIREVHLHFWLILVDPLAKMAVPETPLKVEGILCVRAAPSSSCERTSNTIGPTFSVRKYLWCAR